MTDDEVLISYVKDKAQECEENAVITHTDFLNLKAQSDAVAVLNKMKNVRFIFTGGYDRKRFFIRQRKMILTKTTS